MLASKLHVFREWRSLALSWDASGGPRRQVAVRVDGCAPVTLGLRKTLRMYWCVYQSQAVSGQTQHTVTITHAGVGGTVCRPIFWRLLTRASRCRISSGDSQHNTGDRLGYRPFDSHRTGANRVADAENWASAAGRTTTQARCGFTNCTGWDTRIREREPDFPRLPEFGKKTKVSLGTDTDRTPKLDWRHGGEYRHLLRAC